MRIVQGEVRRVFGTEPDVRETVRSGGQVRDDRLSVLQADPKLSPYREQVYSL